MKLCTSLAAATAVFAMAATTPSVDAFAPAVRPSSSSALHLQLSSFFSAEPKTKIETEFDGKPSDSAKRTNQYEALQQGSIYNANGDEYNMAELFRRGNNVHVVVMLRSLG